MPKSKRHWLEHVQTIVVALSFVGGFVAYLTIGKATAKAELEGIQIRNEQRQFELGNFTDPRVKTTMTVSKPVLVELFESAALADYDLFVKVEIKNVSQAIVEVHTAVLDVFVGGWDTVAPGSRKPFSAVVKGEPGARWATDDRKGAVEWHRVKSIGGTDECHCPEQIKRMDDVEWVEGSVVAGQIVPDGLTRFGVTFRITVPADKELFASVVLSYRDCNNRRRWVSREVVIPIAESNPELAKTKRRR